MLNASSDLPCVVNAYTVAMIDVDLIREALRYYRKKHFSSSRRAATAADLDPSTVAKIENRKSWPHYDPGIGIILKLLQAMDMSLTEFVANVRELDIASTEPTDKTRDSRGTEFAPPVRVEPRGSANEPLPAPTEEDYRAAIRLLAAIAGREAERADAAHRRLPPGAAGEPPIGDRDRVRRVRGPVSRSRKRPGKRG
jgi:transcriptional regulator with XRE-family HTH domain